MKNGINSIEDLLLLIFVLVLVVIAAVLLFTVFQLRESTKKVISEKTGLPYEPFRWSTWWKALQGTSVSVQDEGSIMLSHDYDGIKELDNHLPPWWTGLFYGTIVFAVGYLLVYHVWNKAPLPAEEYAIAMAKAESQAKASADAGGGAAVDENNVTVVTDPALIEKGKDAYVINCMACHGMAGEGTVGPNLTDEYWLHGGSIHDIFKTIKYGVPEKGMISWQSMLKPNEIQNIASYILTLAGTNPPNAKAAEGEKYVPEAAPAATEAPAEAPAEGK